MLINGMEPKLFFQNSSSITEFPHQNFELVFATMSLSHAKLMRP